MDQFDGEISSFGEKVNFGGTQHVKENNEKEKLRNNVGEREEEGLCHYERVSIDLQGKISSDISVDRYRKPYHPIFGFWFGIAQAWVIFFKDYPCPEMIFQYSFDVL